VNPTRVVVAEDDVLMREGLAGLLGRGGYEVVGQAGDGSELLRLVRDYRPDLAIVDIRMPPNHSTEGLEAAATIREEFPDTAILILSAHVEVAHAMTLLTRWRNRGPAGVPRRLWGRRGRSRPGCLCGRR
jgi:DNA-binding NarL/FixJ family response regulator